MSNIHDEIIDMSTETNVKKKIDKIFDDMCMGVIEDLDQEILKYPNNAELYRQRGIEYFHKGNIERAIEDFNQSIKLDRNNTLAYNNRAFMYFHLGKYDNAIADWETVLQIDQNDATAVKQLEIARKKLQGVIN